MKTKTNRYAIRLKEHTVQLNSIQKISENYFIFSLNKSLTQSSLVLKTDFLTLIKLFCQ